MNRLRLSIMIIHVSLAMLTVVLENVYASEFEYDESRQSIVIYAPEGQAIREVPLQRENPKLDNLLHRYGRAPIIILIGTSTAGKSTVIEPIKAKYPRLKDYSVDIMCYRSQADIIQRYLPQTYDALRSVLGHEKIVPVALGDEVKFTDSGAQDAADLLRNIWNRTGADPVGFDRIGFEKALIDMWDQNNEGLIYDSMMGIPVILDTVKYSHLQSLYGSTFFAETHIMITFCPLAELSNRLTGRNEAAKANGESSNIRSGSALKQFAELYRPRKNKDEPILQVLTRKECTDAFRLHLAQEINGEGEFLKSLGFTSDCTDMVEITTRAIHYHSIYNTLSRQLIVK